MENQSFGYRQGMNEILAAIIILLVEDRNNLEHFVQQDETMENYSPILRFIIRHFQEETLEADAFILFSSILGLECSTPIGPIHVQDLFLHVCTPNMFFFKFIYLF